jgi:hypothetical protein
VSDWVSDGVSDAVVAVEAAGVVLGVVGGVALLQAASETESENASTAVVSFFMEGPCQTVVSWRQSSHGGRGPGPGRRTDRAKTAQPQDGAGMIGP